MKEQALLAWQAALEFFVRSTPPGDHEIRNFNGGRNKISGHF